MSTCQYLGLLQIGCKRPATGVVIASDDSGCIPACWPCGRYAVDEDDGARGWLPLALAAVYLAEHMGRPLTRGADRRISADGA